MSKPSAARSGSTAATPENPPHERGNSSYQAPNRARSRSTSRRSTGLFAASWRSPSDKPRGSGSPVVDRALAEELPPLRQLSAEVGLPGRHLAVVLVEPARVRIDPGLDPELPGPERVGHDGTLEAIVALRLERRLAPAACSRRPEPTTVARILSWPSRKIVAETGTVSPRHALTGKRPQSTCGRTSWIWIRGGAITDKVNSLAMWLTRSIGVNLHPTSLPGGRLGPEAYAFVDWLAAAGARFWQVLPLNPPDDYGSPYCVCLGLRGLARAPRRPGRRRCALRAAPVRGGERVLDRRLGRLRRGERAGRPGAVPARMVGSARLRRRPRRAARSATSRSTSPPAAATTRRIRRSSFPATSWRARRPTRSTTAARSGATRSTTGTRSAREGYRWWIERMRRMLGLVDRLPDRPLPRLRRLLDGSGGRGDGA